MYLPCRCPVLPVCRPIPTPIELLGRDVVEKHSVVDQRFSRLTLCIKCHLVVLKLPGQIEVTILVIHPRLPPFAPIRVISRNTYPFKRNGRSSIEIFLNGLPIKDCIDMVRTALVFALRNVPIAYPKIELAFLVGLFCNTCRL